MIQTSQDSIISLGFSEKEAQVYLALLEIGIGSAVTIARKAAIKRPTTYVVLDELIQRGAVITVPQSDKKLYRAIPPKILFETIEERLRQAKAMLPEIEALAATESYKPKVLFFEGIGGVKEVLKYGMDELAGKEIKGFYAKTSSEIMKRFDNYQEYNAYLKKNKIQMRGIAPKDQSLKPFRKSDEDFGRNFKEVDKEKYSSDVAIEIGETFVRFFDPVNLQALVIENPAITKTLSQIFEMIWRGKV